MNERPAHASILPVSLRPTIRERATGNMEATHRCNTGEVGVVAGKAHRPWLAA